MSLLIIDNFLSKCILIIEFTLLNIFVLIQMNSFIDDISIDQLIIQLSYDVLLLDHLNFFDNDLEID